MKFLNIDIISGAYCKQKVIEFEIHSIEYYVFPFSGPPLRHLLSRFIEHKQDCHAIHLHSLFPRQQQYFAAPYIKIIPRIRASTVCGKWVLYRTSPELLKSFMLHSLLAGLKNITEFYFFIYTLINQIFQNIIKIQLRQFSAY